MIKEKATPHIGLVTDLTTGQIDETNLSVKQSNSPTKMEKLAASTHRSK